VPAPGRVRIAWNFGERLEKFRVFRE
jgi:hypothetical protein